jgi:hypothetical protein
MSTLTAKAINSQNTAVGVMVLWAFIMHQIPIYLSADNSKHPPEDTFIKEDDRKPLVEGSSGHRWAAIARNNSENLWQGVIVMIVANMAVYRGTSPTFNVNKKDNAGMYTFLTVLIYIFILCRFGHNACYKFGINGPVPFRSIFYFIGNLAVWAAAILILVACSQFMMDTSVTTVNA